MRQKTRQRTGADGDVAANLDVAFAQRAGGDLGLFAGVRVGGDQSFGGQQVAEPSVNLGEPGGCGGASCQSAGIYPRVNRKLRCRFALQIAFCRFGAVVVLQCTLDIDGVSVVALYQVAVIAVHRPDQIGEGAHNAPRQAVPEAGSAAGQFDGKVRQGRAVSAMLADQQWFHQADRFPPVDNLVYFGRFFVRYHIRNISI